MNFFLTLMITLLVSVNIYSFKAESESNKPTIQKASKKTKLDKTYYLSVSGKCLEADNKALESFVAKVVKSPKKKAQKLLKEFQSCQSSKGWLAEKR